ncbi:hypothetical protein, partial [Leuconostoc mesenteroides]|uniref:hypothetical protein n=1 Tax=Leuconostoc mesenteroides TaxID=1245 RepID=UPI00236197AE
MTQTWKDGDTITSDRLNKEAKIAPQGLITTLISNNKSSGKYNVISGSKDLYVINDLIEYPGVVNITGKFSQGDVYFYLLKKNANSFFVIDKIKKTINEEGWNDIVTDFYAKGTGDEYIGIIGKVYFSYHGGKGFYNLSSADINATKFITSNLVADSDFSIFATIENSNLSKVINEKIGNNEFKTGIKDFSKYTETGSNTTYVMNEPLKDGNLRLHIKSATSQSGSVCIVKKDGLKFTILDKKTINFVVGENLVDMNYKAIGDGTEYIATTGSINYANSGGNGLFSLSSGSSVGNINDSFNVDDHTNWTTDIGIYVEYKSELSEKCDDLSQQIASVDTRVVNVEKEMPINRFKDGIKDFSKYTVASANTTYVTNKTLQSGPIIAHVKSNQDQTGFLYVVQKKELEFTILSKVVTKLTAGENIIDMEYVANGSGDEYLATTGVINYAYNGGSGFYQISSGSTVNNEGDVFSVDDHTDVTTDFGVYPEYKGELSEKYDDLSKKINAVTPNFSLTDFNMPKYSEIVDPVGFVGRWFDKTIHGVQTKTTINQGSEFYFKVKNTKTINVNFVLNSDLETPYFAYSIDGSAMKRQLITTPSLTAVTTDEHIVRVVIDGLNEHEDKWKGEKGVSFKNVTVDLGGTVTGVLPKNRKIMFFGDSITEGIRVLSMDANPNGNSATGAWPFIASEQLNSISYRVGFGASGVTTGGSGYVPPLLQNIDSMTA